MTFVHAGIRKLHVTKVQEALKKKSSSGSLTVREINSDGLPKESYFNFMLLVISCITEVKQICHQLKGGADPPAG